MKKLMKSEVCGSCEQYKGPVGVHYSQEKVNNHGLKKKKEKKKREENAENADTGSSISKPHLNTINFFFLG